MKAITLAAVLVGVGCSPPPTHAVRIEQEEWLVDATHRALDFWAERGINIVESEDGLPIKIGKRNHGSDELGNFGVDLDEEYGWSIYIAPEVETWPVFIDKGDYSVYTGGDHHECVIAHEIGHALGMDHVDDNESLMWPTWPNSLKGCRWSDGDDKTLADIVESWES